MCFSLAAPLCPLLLFWDITGAAGSSHFIAEAGLSVLWPLQECVQAGKRPRIQSLLALRHWRERRVGRKARLRKRLPALEWCCWDLEESEVRIREIVRRHCRVGKLWFRWAFSVCIRGEVQSRHLTEQGRGIVERGDNQSCFVRRKRKRVD